jgi:hypothetical protein
MQHALFDSYVFQRQRQWVRRYRSTRDCCNSLALRLHGAVMQLRLVNKHKSSCSVLLDLQTLYSVHFLLSCLPVPCSVELAHPSRAQAPGGRRCSMLLVSYLNGKALWLGCRHARLPVLMVPPVPALQVHSSCKSESRTIEH